MDHARRLKNLLAPLDLTNLKASYDTLIALKTRLPADQGLTTYYDNIHRDWNWGDAENSASLELVQKALGHGGLGETALVLGAGAGRLAYDLHQASDTSLTVAKLQSAACPTRTKRYERRFGRTLRISDRAKEIARYIDRLKD